MQAQSAAWERPLDERHWQAVLEQGAHSPQSGAIEDPLAALVGLPHEAPPAEGRDAFRHTVNEHDDAFWDELSCWQESGQVFTAPVIGSNKGGLLVRINDAIGFVPASQLANLPPSLGSAELSADLEAMVGSRLELRLIEVDRRRNRIICSERATMWADSAIDHRLDELETRIGSEVVGTVRTVCDFGAFVDLGGVDGLIHISELSWRRIRHPGDVVASGTSVRVLVLHVDHGARRVGLSLKRLEPDPWMVVAQRYAVGDVIDALITNVVPFGAFARVAEGVEGLIHLSELTDGTFSDPREIVTDGQAVRVRVLHIDPTARRLGLSLRQVRDG